MSTKIKFSSTPSTGYPDEKVVYGLDGALDLIKSLPVPDRDVRREYERRVT